MIESIAYDLEGTVVDVEFAHHQGHIYAAEKVGVILTLEDCFQKLPHFMGGPDDQVAKEIAALALQNGTEVSHESILENKRNHYELLLKEAEIRPRIGFLNFFNIIKYLGLECTIGSLTDREHAEVLLDRSGVGKLFGNENIVLREHVKNLKPAPDVWYETAKRAGVNPADQLVFEDSPKGIKGAAQVGAYCIGMPVYNRPDIISALVNAGAKRIFMEWDEINPAQLIENINEELGKPGR